MSSRLQLLCVWISGLALAWICGPLILPILFGGMLAVLCAPLQKRLLSRGWNRWLAASTINGAMTLLFFLPLGFVVFVGIKAGLEQLQALKAAPTLGDGNFFEELIYSTRTRPIIEWVVTVFRVDLGEVIQSLSELARTSSLKLGEALSDVLASLPSLMLGGAISVVTFFFCLVDGSRLVSFLKEFSVFPEKETHELFKLIERMCRSVLLASVMSGSVQALIMGFAALVFKAGNPPLLMILVFVASFVPVIGSAPITFGVALYHLVVVGTGSGIALVVAAMIISTADNVVRPLFLRGTVNLHPLVALVTALGGLQVLGFVGVFLGPISAGLFLAVWSLYQRTGRPLSAR